MENARILTLTFVAVLVSISAGQHSRPLDINDDGLVDISDVELVCDNWLWMADEIEGMVLIPGGEFEMGDHVGDGLSHELPVHVVRLDSFYVGRYEVTNGQYCDYLNSAKSKGEIKVLGSSESYYVYSSDDGANSRPYYDTHISRSVLLHTQEDGFFIDSRYERDVSNDPVFDVSWYGTAAYCNWRSLEEGCEECYDLSTWECDFTKNGYRLPTEAEWEYAARGGQEEPLGRFAWGNNISHAEANYRATRNQYGYDVSLTKLWHPDWGDGPGTSPVGSFAANGYGLYDMHGNVAEWCYDRHGCGYYGESVYRNPTGPLAGAGRTLRGGSWQCDAKECRITHRGGTTPDGVGTGTGKAGFRIVLGGRRPSNSADINDDGIVDMSDVAAVCATVGHEDMVRIPAGTFEMGDKFNEGWPDEKTIHTVRLDAFHMGRHEITNQQYCDYLNDALSEGGISVSGHRVCAAGSGAEGQSPYCCIYHPTTYSQIEYSGGAFRIATEYDRGVSDDPVQEVTWCGAAAYCNWRSRKEDYEECYDPATWVCDFSKKGYRLPTEAEWEYAARGGHSVMRFPWGDTISHYWANYCSGYSEPYDVSQTCGFHPACTGSDYPYTAPAGAFAATGYGLHGMVGNVPEWCNDWYDCDYYRNSPMDNPTGPANGEYRVLRGGDWLSPANHCRTAKRDWCTPDAQPSRAGFRVVLDLN